jgi:uncharacterized protein (TIGR03435 family)
MDRSSASLIFLTLVVGNSQTFEVASVKPSTQTTGRITMKGGPGTSDPTRIAYSNIMLKRLLIGAYDVRSDQIVGPDWLDIQRFDIAATLPEGATREQFQAMLRNLLETRFRMTIHRETKELPIYALIPLKKGTKLRADSDSPVTPTEEHLAVIQSKDGRDGFPALKITSPGLVI